MVDVIEIWRGHSRENLFSGEERVAFIVNGLVIDLREGYATESFKITEEEAKEKFFKRPKQD